MLWSLFLLSAAALILHRPRPYVEGFVAGDMRQMANLSQMSTQALDAAPTTSEVKNHYKVLLLFADGDIRANGTAGLRLLADLRDRLFGPRNFRASLQVSDFLGGWPSWLPPLDSAIKEPIPKKEDAVTAEVRILAYLQRNFPQESEVSEDTGSTLRNLVEDVGRRFVFETGQPVQLRDDFLRKPLLTGWQDPTTNTD